MRAPSDNLPPEEAVRDRAVAWQVRLASEAAEDSDWLAFEAWLAEAPEHRAAYDEVERLWMDLDEVAPAGLRAADNVVPLRRPREPARPTRRAAFWVGPIAASLIAAAVVGVSVWPDNPHTESFQTVRGERRTIDLSDGSRVILNGGSRIAVSMGRRERRVFMADAEAAFDVARDAGRPFRIQAGDREVRVVGTEFNVLRHDGQVRVTVRRGVVEIRRADDREAAPLARLRRGQGLRHREGQAVDVVAAADPDAAFAWTEGRLVFRGEPLHEVATTLNRYVPTPITVSPEARDLPVTAVLNLGPEEQMLDSLRAFLPVQAERRADSVRLSLRRETR